MPVYALRFGVNDHIKQFVAGKGNNTRSMGTPQLVLCGTIAGFVQQMVTYPLDLIKSRMALDHQIAVRYNGMLDCAAVTIRSEGVLAMYKGLTASVIYGAPYVGLQMTLYAEFKKINGKGTVLPRESVLRV